LEQSKYKDRWKHVPGLIAGKTQGCYESTINHWSRRLIVVHWNNPLTWNDIKKMDYKTRFVETDKLFIVDFSKFHNQLKKEDYPSIDAAIRDFHAHFMKYHISIFHDVITFPKAIKMLMFDGILQKHIHVPTDTITFHLLKDAIVGGMGQVNRHLASNDYGNFVSIESWDCTSMYAYALLQDMPCGKSIHQIVDKSEVNQLLDRIRNNSFVGFIRCSVDTPKHLRPKFSDLPIVIDKSCKNVYTSDDVVVWCTLVKFYLEQGLQVQPIECVEYEYSRPLFASYVEHCVRDRIEADKSENKGMIQIQKFKLSAAHGMTHVNPKNHSQIIICDTQAAYKHVKDYYFKSCKVLQNDKFAIMKTREKIIQQEPIQLAAAVYAESKLHFFRFFYNCLKPNFYDWEPLAFQTDAIVIGLKKNSLLECQIPGSDISEWFSLDDKTRRVPGLFHLDKKGKCFVAYGQNNYSITEDKPVIPITFKNRKRMINADGYTTSPGNIGS
jgi:hypothetical protein